MINLLLSLAAGIAVVILVKVFGFSLVAGIVPGTVVFLALLVVMGRRSFTQLQVVIQASAGRALEHERRTRRSRQAKADKAIKMLEAALPLGKWQFLIEAEIYGQIGMIKHLFKDFDGALDGLPEVEPAATTSPRPCRRRSTSRRRTSTR